MFVNEYEFELVKKKTDLSLEDILSYLKFLVVTLGPEGAVIYHQSGEERIKAVSTDRIVDPTGGGDAFRGGFLTGYGMKFDWRTCGEMGSLAATYCLESDGPQGHNYSIEEFISRYREHYQDEGRLDALINQKT